eukprot:gene16657-16836_t
MPGGRRCFHHLLPEFGALDNVALPMLIAGRSRRVAVERAEELLTRLGLGQRLDHQPATGVSFLGIIEASQASGDLLMFQFARESLALASVASFIWMIVEFARMVG